MPRNRSPFESKCFRLAIIHDALKVSWDWSVEEAVVIVGNRLPKGGDQGDSAAAVPQEEISDFTEKTSSPDLQTGIFSVRVRSRKLRSSNLLTVECSCWYPGSLSGRLLLWQTLRGQLWRYSFPSSFVSSWLTLNCIHSYSLLTIRHDSLPSYWFGLLIQSTLLYRSNRSAQHAAQASSLKVIVKEDFLMREVDDSVSTWACERSYGKLDLMRE